MSIFEKEDVVNTEVETKATPAPEAKPEIKAEATPAPAVATPPVDVEKIKAEYEAKLQLQETRLAEIQKIQDEKFARLQGELDGRFKAQPVETPIVEDRAKLNQEFMQSQDPLAVIEKRVAAIVEKSLRPFAETVDKRIGETGQRINQSFEPAVAMAKENVKSKYPEVFNKYEKEIDGMVKGLPLEQRANPALWEWAAYAHIGKDAAKEMTEKRQRERAGEPLRPTGSREVEKPQISDAEKHMQKVFEMTDAEWVEYKGKTQIGL